MIYFFIAVIILVLILVVVFFFQSRIQTPEFHDAFVTQQSERVYIKRKSNDAITLHWDAAFQPTVIQQISSPHEDQIVREWRQLTNKHKIEIEQNKENARIFFKLLNQDTQIITAERELSFQRINNFRDFGGYFTPHSQVAWGKIYRSGHMANATNSDLKKLAVLKLATVIDLRDEVEIEKHPDRIPESVKYEHVYIANRQMVSSSTVLFRRERMGGEFIESYKTSIIDQGAKGLGQVLRLLSDPKNLPAVIHCTAGKDRTGVAAALVLLLLGVPEETVIADYSMSNQFARQLIQANEAWINKGHWLGMRVEQFYPLFSAHPFILQETLGHIKTKYQTFENYVSEQAGVDNDVIQKLRANLLIK